MARDESASRGFETEGANAPYSEIVEYLRIMASNPGVPLAEYDAGVLRSAAEALILASLFRRMFDDEDVWIKLLDGESLYIDGSCKATHEEVEAIRRLAASRGRSLIHD